jgi:hypothetical protein
MSGLKDTRRFIQERNRRWFRERLRRRERQGRARSEQKEQELIGSDRPQDERGEPGARTKSSGHGKKVADKWNQ